MSPARRSTAPSAPAPAPATLTLKAGAVGVLVLGALGVIAVLAADAAGGPAAVVLANAGPLARHGAPVAALLADLAGSLVLGGAVVAAWILPRSDDRARARLLGALAIAACVWTLAQLASLLTSYAVATGQPIGSGRFGSDLPVYLATDLGLWLLVALILAGVTTALAAGAATRRGAIIVVLGAAASLGAKAMTGHASGSASHETATSTMAVHLLAAGVWIGGLAALQLAPGRDAEAPAVVQRFSRLALVCWGALAASGVWALAVRMNGLGDLLTSAYVQLAAIKALLLVILGGAGWMQRRLLAQRAHNESTAARELYRRLALLELCLMGLALALAAAMSSSPPPADQSPAASSPAELLTDYPLPPAPTLGQLLGQWRPDALALAVACALVLTWWWPTAPRRSRARTRCLLGGTAALLLITCGPVAVYAKVLFSAHLAEHVLLLTVAGPLLGLAWGQGSRLRTRSLACLVAAACPLLLGAVWASGHLDLALTSHVGHVALLAAATVPGAVLGVAAARTPWAAVSGGVVLVALGLVLALGDVLVAASWFGATGRPYRADALADQRSAGWALAAWGLAWTLIGTGVGAFRAQWAARGRSSRSPSSPKTSLARRSRASASARSTKGS